MSKFLVVAIDFGTTFSGYAFSFRDEYKRDRLKISTKVWYDSLSTLVSEKTSTCVLFDSKGNFHSFGFEAEEKYFSLACDNNHHDWYFFRHFKMMLYNEKKMTIETPLLDDKGKKMKAIDVFSSAINYLKNQMIKQCEKRFKHIDIMDSDVTWVLTVPAIWNDSSKQFMREAAKKAGICDQMLIIALEPEAASLYCMYQPVLMDPETSSLGVFQTGAKYLVVDAGGGTIDITVHEVQNNGTLKEIHKANGGDWGGTKVDASFRNLLSEIVGKDVLDAFCSMYKCDYFEFLRDFEVKKRSIRPDFAEKLSFNIPITLIETFKKMNPGKNIGTDSKTKYINKLSLVGNKLRIDAQLCKAFYDESLTKIVGHLRQLFRDSSVKDVSSILLVGGYGESPMLQKTIREAFPNQKVIVPQDAGLAVLKGAVLYGYEPTTISDRVCRYTYGLRIHPKSKKFVENGVDRCTDIFDIHVRVGQSVKVGKPQVERSYTVVNPDQTKMTFEIYTSRTKDPMYTTDEGCEYLGEFSIDMPDKSKGMDRGAKVHMTFSGTEIHVKAVDKDNNEKNVSTSVNFLG